jgi:hypothetical protein
LAKVNAVLLNLTLGRLVVVPVPVNEIVCGEPLALSVILTLEVFAPVRIGENTTEIEQLAPAVNVAPQVFDNLKSCAWLPVSTIEVNERLAVPPFVTVTDFAAELVSTN